MDGLYLVLGWFLEALLYAACLLAGMVIGYKQGYLAGKGNDHAAK